MNIFAYLSTRALGDFTTECLWVASIRAILGGRLTVFCRGDRPYKRAIVEGIHNADVLRALEPDEPAPTLEQFDLSHGKVLSGDDMLDRVDTRGAGLVLTSSMMQQKALNAMPLTVLRPPAHKLRAAKPYLQNLGLDPAKWFAVVYWKEPGYQWRKPNAMRTIFDPGPYLDAIAHIVALGGQVVRIGHPTATVIPQLPGVVDLAKIPDSEGLQLACVPLARFMLASGSGPAAYGSAFGIPTVQTDSMDCYGVWRDQDYILTQGFEFDGDVQRQTKALAYGLLNSSLGRSSVVQIRNTGAELIAAVDEMMAVSAIRETWTPPEIPTPVLGSLTFPQPRDVSSRLLIAPSARIVGKLGG